MGFRQGATSGAVSGAAYGVLKADKQDAKPKTKDVHGNSKESTKKQHGYKIIDQDGNTQEYGISGQKLNKDGNFSKNKTKIKNEI